MKSYMLDTMIFNRILHHGLDLNSFKKSHKTLFATHVQRDEIKNTQDATRRDELLSVFNEVADDSISTETAFWGISRWGKAKWAEDDLAQEILEELNIKKQEENNPKDALIADTAIKNNYILVTDDGDLYDVVTENFNGSAQKWKDFLNSP